MISYLIELDANIQLIWEIIRGSSLQSSTRHYKHPLIDHLQILTE